MKEKYLEKLSELLGNYQIAQDEFEDIIADYSEMIDDAIAKNLSEAEIIKMIGTPEQVIDSLKDDFEEGEDFIYIHRSQASLERKHRDNRLTALMPFISLIVFFILGFAWGLWHPGWLVFLSIPMTAIIINAFDKKSMNGFIALSPFIALIAYMILGFGWSLWHPGWLVFLVIPIIAISSNIKQMRFVGYLTAISPFLAVITFILVGTYAGIWNPIWLVFLIIPMIGILNERKIWKVLLMEFSILLGIAVYLYSGYVLGEWGFGAFAFLIPLGVSMLMSDEPYIAFNRKNRLIWVVALATLVIYIGFGLLISSTWGYLWMIFFAIPITAILRHSNKKDKLVACMPFIAIIIFYTLGYFWQVWAYSWLAFLLIPMVAIITHAK